MTKESFQLKIGDKIEIFRINAKNNKHSSQILDILNEKEYIISGPIRRSTIIHVNLNTILGISYFKEGKGKFSFKALVTGKSEKGIYKLKIERLDDIVKIQERDFFRLSQSLKVEKKFKVKDKKEDIVLEEICRTSDISGGGVKIFSNYKHQENDQFMLTFNIDNREINILGEAVRVSESNRNDYSYEIGVKFLNIDNSERETIIRYIFEQQRELRKKGLI